MKTMSEQALVTNLLRSPLRFPWRTQAEILHKTEVRVTSNRVDVVYYEKKNEFDVGFIAAVEVKLHDWRKALQQAHRNKLFADRVYVALPAEFSSSAMINLAEFRRASIGLIIIDGSGAKIHFHPPLNKHRSNRHVIKVKQTLCSTSH
ncbi:MAG TPA: hypothetical protein VFR24_25380 [Candidatus Angelobacter sp.]|nr:hypothetical protein [Candidatus Angelobacter sp.]